MSRIGIVVMAVLAVSVFESEVAAQGAGTLVLPWSIEGADDSTASRASEIRAALGARVPVLSADDARSRFVQRGSADPPSVTESEVDQWLALSRQAVHSLADADYASARASLEQAQALSDRAAAELNREEARARQVLDTCLFGVRAYVETSDPHAESAAMECRRLVPRIAPTPRIHTPEVVQVLERVDRRLAADRLATLTIESDPPDCVSRISGVVFGHTPLTTSDLAPGEYRVQVECGDTGRGRVHRVTLGSEPTTLHVDAAFDAVVRTAGGLALGYHDIVESEQRRIADGREIARLIGADEVWLVSGETIERVRVASGEVVASVYGASRQATADIVAAVSRGQSLGERPPTLALGEDPAHDHASHAVDVGPWVLVGTGAAAVVAGAVLLGVGLPDYNATGAPVAAEARYAQALARQSAAEPLVDAGIAVLCVGGAVVVGGIVWAAVPSSGGTEPAVSFRLSPTGMTIEGSF